VLAEFFIKLHVIVEERPSEIIIVPLQKNKIFLLPFGLRLQQKIV